MKEDRFEFRASHQERRQIEEAASFLDMNISAYLEKRLSKNLWKF